MPSLGEAYITVHADTAPFQRELQAQVTKSTAAIEKAQNAPARQRAANPSNSDETKALQAQTAKNKLLYKADQDFKIAAAKEAEEAIKRVNRDTAQQITNDLNRQVTAEKAAAEAKKALAKEVARAERDAYAESTARARAAADEIRRINRDTAQQLENDLRRQTTAAKAAAAAEREMARAAKEADDNHKGLSDRLVALSSGLSRIGFTGQTRLLTLGLTAGAPVALLGAFSAAAAVATAAVTVFGIKSADAARSATLQFQSLGLTAAEAKKQFADLQALSNKGLQIANLDADASRLLQLGINAKDVTKILGTLGDIFSANGDTGATLQKDIDDTAKKFATLVNTAKVTPRTFQTAVASLGLGTTAQAVFDQIKKNLDVTSKQLDDLIAKGKLSGSAVAQAALQAASAGTGGALDKAGTTSPTQALEALKSSAQSTLASAFGASGTTIAGFIKQVSDQLNGFLAKFAPRVIQTLQETLPQLISALQPFGNALIATMQLVGPAFEAIGPIVTNLSDKISGFFSQVNVQGSGTQTLMHDLGTVFEELGLTLRALGPVVTAIGHGLADVAHQLASLKPVVEVLTAVFHALAATHLGSFIVEIGTVAVVTRIGVSLLGKALLGVAGFAAEGALAMKNFGNASAIAGTQASIAAAKIEGAGAAGAVAGAEGAVGGFAGSKLGKILNGSAAKATIIIPLLVAAGQAGHALGEKLAGANSAMDKAQANAEALAPAYQILGSNTDQLGLSVDTLSQHLSAVGIQTLATSIQAGSYTDIAAGMVKALEAQGLSADDTAIALEGMGVSVQNAQNAVNGLDTTGAQADLYAFQVAALEADGAVRRTISDLQIAAQLGGSVADPDGAFTSAATVAANTPLVDSIHYPTAGVGTGGSTGKGGGGGGGAAKAAADKIKSAFADLSGDLKAIADKTSEQTASQIKSEFNALIKDLKDSGNSALVAGTKVIEQKLLDRIKKLKPLQDKLAAELSLAQGVKDSVTSSGSIDSGTGIATTFAGIQNKLRFSVANTQQFITAIKKLQAEKLNRTSIKQLIDNYASDPSGALAAAQALVSAGQAGITGAGGINDLQNQLTELGNTLGNDTAGELYKQGQHIGDGLIEGLKSKVKEAEKVINDLADKMAAAIKKKTKSHSPSEVYAEIGGDIVDGLVGGINGGSQKVAAAATGMAQTVITFGPGSVAVNNADPKNPAGSGLMVGHGIVGVLDRNKTQSVLAGVG